MGRRGERTFSMRGIRPFLRVLARDPRIPKERLEEFARRDPDERIPVHAALTLMERVIALTGDQDLGLRAALRSARGEFDLVEFVVASSATYRDCIALIRRYIRLLNDAVELDFETRDGTAIAQWSYSLALGRIPTDFLMASFYLAFARRATAVPDLRLEICFAHEEPDDTRLYRRIFRAGRLRFSAPFDGFVFDEHLLDRPTTGGDPRLHTLLRRLAEERLAELPEAAAMTQRVRVLATREVSGGEPTAEHISSLLHMSRRTLARRLEQEGTSFRAIMDDLRRGLAERYLALDDLGMSEIAALLGFSDPAAFHRAFRRWRGQSPSEYRREHRLAAADRDSREQSS